MSKVVEDHPVVKEPAAPTPKGVDAFAAARASIRQSEDQAQTPSEPTSPTTPSTETPAEEPAKAADQPPEPAAPDDTFLSADELAALPPKQRAQAEKWQAKLTRKSQELSARSKEQDEWAPLIEGFKTNPDAMLEELARTRGLTLAKPPAQDTPVTTVIQNRFTKAITALPEELRPLFQPALEALGQDILASVESQLQPIATAQDKLVSEAAAMETEATIQAFAKTHPGWEQHEARMVELGKKFIPQPGISAGEYMDTLFKLATADLAKVEQVKETVKAINRSVAAVEPQMPGVAEARVEETMPANWATMTSKERMRAAYEAAGRGVVWKK